MFYSILIYGSEERAEQWAPEEMGELMGRHADLRRDLEAQRRMGPVLRLTPHTTRTVRRYKDRDFVIDGPYAESKETLMGLYVVDCVTFEDAVACAKRLEFDTCRFEISELSWLTPGMLTPLAPSELSGERQ